MLLPLSFIATVLYAVVNAVGAWAVIRRKSWLAALFMLAASTLMVAAAAMVSTLGFARVLLACGLLLASISSFLYASIVFGRVTWRHHLIRAVLAGLLYLFTHLALR